jgi:hypothetical protein
MLASRTGAGSNRFFEAAYGALSAYHEASKRHGLAKGVVRDGFVLSTVPIVLFASQVPIFWLAGFIINWPTILSILGICVFCLLTNILFIYRYREPVIGAVFASVPQLMLSSGAVIGFSYVALQSGAPFADAELAYLDRWLGLDWHAYKDWIISDPDRLYIASYFYQTLGWQVVAVGFVLVVCLEFRAFHTLCFAWLLAALVTVSVSAAMPPLAAFYHYGIVDEMKAVMLIDSGYIQIEPMLQIKQGLSLDPYKNPAGIVAFPSFHAAGAVMLSWAFWQINYLRWPMLAINCGMIAATPIIGSHYFVDVIAGVALAFAAIHLGKRITGHGGKQVFGG